MIPAIYVRQTKAIPYADDIISGIKTIETRNRNTLGRFVGQRVFIIKTCAGHKATVIGDVTITGAAYHTAQELDALRDQTMIPKDSKFDCKGNGKWCYTLSDPTPTVEPLELDCFPVVYKTRSFAMIKG